VWAWSAGLYLTLALGCAAIIRYSSGQPSANRAAELGLGICAGRPCFRGLVPGDTRWTDAVVMLEGLRYRGIQYSAGASGSLSYIISGKNFKQHITLYAAHEGSALASIYLHIPRSERLTVSDILALYGPPTCVDTRYRSGDSLLLHYPALHILVPAGRNRFGSATPVLSVLLGHAVGQPDDLCDLSPGNNPNQQPWRGFAFIRKYLNAG
jgi:hypothetical protein